MKLRTKIFITLLTILLVEVALLTYISEAVVFVNNNKIIQNEDSNNLLIIKVDKDLPVQTEKIIMDDLEEIDKIEEIIEEEVDDNNLDTSTGTLNIIFNVPFTAQAPFANWADPIHQDGCEEATSLMAVSWARGETFNLSKAKEEIILASNYQEENYGDFRDTSSVDTLKRIIIEYFKYENAVVDKNITINDIIFELINGNIVILPMDGQALENPYFTPPGPERHMLVVIGYNEENKEFIVNDPGTKRGERFRYDENLLYDAIRDYHTGFHIPIESIEKNMIVVSPAESLVDNL